MFTEQEVLKLIADSIEKSIILMREGKNSEAELILKQASKVKPDSQDVLQLLGLTKYRQGKYQDAIDVFTGMLAKTQSPDTYNNLGLCYASTNDNMRARSNLRRATEIDPENADYRNNFGMACRKDGDLEKALQNLKKATMLAPDRKHFHLNLGSLFGEMHWLDMSEKSLKRAIELDPEFAAAHVDLAYCYHLQGKWEEGFKHYEYRFQNFPRMNKWIDHFGKDRLWDGSAKTDNRHMVVWCEQGVGDAVMFSRYLRPLAEKTNAKITMVTNLLDTHSFFDTQKDALGLTNVLLAKPDNYDYHCSIVSLPNLLQLGPIPPAKLNVKRWDWGGNRTDSALKVGVCWAGSPAHPLDRDRSVNIKRFEPLTEINGARIISLQREHCPRAYHDDPRPVNLSEGWEKSKIENIDDREPWPDLAGLADWIKGLDLVITVDTAVLHLAGSLGVQTWGLLPYNPDWRWKLPEFCANKSPGSPDKTPWYDTVYLFRQPARGDWDSVFRTVTAELRGMVKGWRYARFLPNQ
jgi:tetratricopeptide (TPR) repeat protein